MIARPKQLDRIHSSLTGRKAREIAGSPAMLISSILVAVIFSSGSVAPANASSPPFHLDVTSCSAFFVPAFGHWDQSTNTCTLSPGTFANQLITSGNLGFSNELIIDPGTTLYITGDSSNTFTFYNDCNFFGEDCATITNEGTIIVASGGILNDAGHGSLGGNGAG
ncbi:MAG: hypothetical protein WA799_08810, partial [Nitrosotalea sp.]